MQFHYVILSLFKPFRNAEQLGPGQRFYSDRAGDILSNCIKEMRQLIHLFAYAQGFRVCTNYMIHMLVVASYLALDEIGPRILNDLNSTEAYASLVECIIGLGQLATKYLIAQGALKAIQIRSRDLNIDLCHRAKEAMKIVEIPGWLHNISKRIRSQYPADQSSSLDDPDSGRLDRLIQSWEGLSIEDSPRR